MIVMKFGGTSVQDAEAINRVAAIVRERLQLETLSSANFCPTTRQVSGHEFTRAAQPQNIAGFSPCKNLSAPPRLRGGFAAKAFLRASVPPWWRLSS